MKLSNNIYIIKFNKEQYSYTRNPSIHLDFKKYFILMNTGETDILKYYNNLRQIFNRRYTFWNEMYEELQIPKFH